MTDQLQHEIQELQVENVKLKANQSVPEGVNTQDSAAAEGLQQELEDLRARLHDAEQRELDAGQRVTALEEQQATAGETIAALREENANLAQEVTQVRQQCANHVIELKQLRETSELVQFCTVDRERQKWEAQEANLMAELLRYRSRHDEVPQSLSLLTDNIYGMLSVPEGDRVVTHDATSLVGTVMTDSREVLANSEPRRSLES